MACTALPNAYCGITYSQSLGTTGCFYLKKGCLPPGLTLSNLGLLSGIPCKMGCYTFRVSNGCSKQTYTLKVACTVVRQPEVMSVRTTTPTDGIILAWKGNLVSQLSGATYSLSSGLTTTLTSLSYSIGEDATFLNLAVSGTSNLEGQVLTIKKDGCITEITLKNTKQ